MAKRTRRSQRKPREWMTSPAYDFGRRVAVTWHMPTSLEEEAQLEAAQVQHRLSRAVREQRERLGMKPEVLAATVGLSVGQVRSILSGKAHVSTAHMHAFGKALHIKVDIRVSVQRSDG